MGAQRRTWRSIDWSVLVRQPACRRTPCHWGPAVALQPAARWLCSGRRHFTCPCLGRVRIGERGGRRQRRRRRRAQALTLERLKAPQQRRVGALQAALGARRECGFAQAPGCRRLARCPLLATCRRLPCTETGLAPKPVYTVPFSCSLSLWRLATAPANAGCRVPQGC